MQSNLFILVVGTSAGGTVVLPELISQFKSEMNIAIFIVIHMTKHEVGDLLVSRMQKQTKLKCKIPRHNEKIRKGYIYFSKPDHHLLLNGEKFLVGKGPRENRYRPSIDALFRSAAAHFDHKAIGIILTGMLEDGAAGLSAIKRAGGICIVQDPNEAQFPEMPEAAIRNLKPHHIIPIAKMGEIIAKIITKQKRVRVKIPANIKKEAAIAERVHIGLDRIESLGMRSSFSCPECGGGLWQLEGNGTLKYRCHVGHAFTEEGLTSAMEASTESALWMALRIIEERKNLLTKLRERETTIGNIQGAARLESILKELEQQVKHLRRVLLHE